MPFCHQMRPSQNPRRFAVETPRLQGHGATAKARLTMLIFCPNCGAGYNVPDQILQGAGRRLRCVRCEQEWLASAPPDNEHPPSPPSVTIPMPATMPVYSQPVQAPAENLLVASIPAKLVRPDSEQPGGSAQTGALLAWALSVCVLISLSWGAVHWRSDVMSIWPPSKRAYQTFGLGTP